MQKRGKISTENGYYGVSLFFFHTDICKKHDDYSIIVGIIDNFYIHRATRPSFTNQRSGIILSYRAYLI